MGQSVQLLIDYMDVLYMHGESKIRAFRCTNLHARNCSRCGVIVVVVQRPRRCFHVPRQVDAGANPKPNFLDI